MPRVCRECHAYVFAYLTEPVAESQPHTHAGLLGRIVPIVAY